MEQKPGAECNPVEDRALALVLDQGGSSSRALVVDAMGRVLARAQQAVAEHRPAPERVEQDPAELVESLRSCGEQALRQLGPRARDCTVAGLCTQRASALAWQRGTHQPLSAVLSWQDRRAHVAVEQLAAHAARIGELSGLRLSPHYGASKLRWLVDHDAAVGRAAARGDLCMGPLAGYVAGSLCRSDVDLVDAVSASRTQLLDLRRQEWSAELAACFGIELGWLPGILPSGSGRAGNFGVLELAGLGIPLSVVTGDQSAAVFASGAPSPGTVLVNLGTGGFVQMLQRHPVRIPGLLTSLLPGDAQGPRFALEGTINGAGSALQWCAEQHGMRWSPELLEEALGRQVEPPLFFNAHGGLAAPWWRPQARSAFSRRGTPAEEIAAVGQSIVFLVVEIVGRMGMSPGLAGEQSSGPAGGAAVCGAAGGIGGATVSAAGSSAARTAASTQVGTAGGTNAGTNAAAVMGPNEGASKAGSKAAHTPTGPASTFHPARIEISGGLSRSDALCQLLADALQLPVWRREEAEASSRGLAWLCLGGHFEELPARCFTPRANHALASRHAAWCAWVQERLAESS